MIHSKRVSSIVLIALLTAGTAAAAYGQEAALTGDQVTERLGFITKALEAGQPRARAWRTGWIAGYSAGAATMGVLAATTWKPEIWTFAPLPADHNAFAQDMLVGSGTFALGVVGLVIDPFTPATAAKTLGALPETSEAERRAKLARAEELLRACARREKRGRSLTTHLLNAGVNAAAGIVTVAAFDRPAGDGLLTFAIGEAVSLLNIFTQPMRATRDLKKYEAGALAASGGGAPRATWSLGVRPGGFSLSLRF